MSVSELAVSNKRGFSSPIDKLSGLGCRELHASHHDFMNFFAGHAHHLKCTLVSLLIHSMLELFPIERRVANVGKNKSAYRTDGIFFG